MKNLLLNCSCILTEHSITLMKEEDQSETYFWLEPGQASNNSLQNCSEVFDSLLNTDHREGMKVRVKLEFYKLVSWHVVNPPSLFSAIMVFFFSFLFYSYVAGIDKMSDSPSLAGQHFGQRRPPLSVTIKAILERYPDGQIFKVCL